MIKLKCINDKNKPDSIPKESWLVEGMTYTILRVMNTGTGVGYQVQEIDLDNTPPTYGFFKSTRFETPPNEIIHIIRATAEENKEEQEKYLDKILEEVGIKRYEGE